MTTPVQAHRARDAGVLTAELMLAVAGILIPVMFLLLAVVQWPEHQGVATAAAAEGARTAALANSGQEADAMMRERVTQVVSTYGLDPSDVTAELSGDFSPGGHLTVEVTIDLPTLTVPGAGDFSAASYTATSTERIELHRVFGS